MDISLFNVRIVFQKNAVEVDAIGNHTNGWTDFYSCHATVSGEGTRQTSESEVAGQTVDNSDIAFTVRWCNKLKAVDSADCRILFESEIYDILSIDHMNFKKKVLKFKCRKARR